MAGIPFPGEQDTGFAIPGMITDSNSRLYEFC